MRTVIILFLAFSCMFTPECQAIQGGGQRIHVLDRLGGQVTAAQIAGPDVLAAEGDSLIRLHVGANGELIPTGRLNLGHGAILDFTSTTNALYALTDTGLVTLSADGSTVRGFTPGGGQLCDAWEDRLAVAAREAGIRLYRLDPDGTPHLARVFMTAGAAQHVAFTESGRLAVADGQGGLRLYNVDDPEHPLLLGAAVTVIPAERVAAEDGRAYVTSGHTLYLIDTSNPASPVTMGVYDPIQDVQAAAWINNYALLADAAGGLKVYDGTGFHYLAGESNSSNDPPRAVIAASGVIVLAEGRTLRLFDAGKLPAIVPLGTVALRGAVNDLAAVRTASGQMVALAALESGGLSVISIPDGALLATLPTPGSARSVTVTGTTAYVSVLGTGLIRVDVSDPSFPAVTAGVPIGGNPGSVALAGELAVVAAGPAGLFVVDVSHREALTLCGWLPPEQEGYTRVVALGSARVAALDGDQLELIDLSSSAAPRILDHSPSDAAALITAGGGTLVAAGKNRLASYDVGAGSLAPLNSYAAPTDLTDVRMLVGRAILTNGGDGAALILLDTQNPGAPRELQAYDVGGPALALRDQGDEIFLAAGGSGLLHTLLPAQGIPQLLGRYVPTWATTALDGDDQRLLVGGAGWYVVRSSGQLWPESSAMVGSVAAVALDGTQAYIAPASGGVLAYDLSSGTPTRTARTETAGPVLDLAPGGGLLWAVDSGTGLIALDPATLERRRGPFWPDGGLQALAVSGTTIYAGLESGALVALDVSGDSFQEIGRLDGLGGPVRSVRLAEDGLIVLSAGQGGVWLVDGHDPAALQTAGHTTPPGGALAAAAQGDRLAVAAGVCGVRLYDIADPTAPVERGFWQNGYAVDVLFQDESIVLATASSVLTLAYDPTGAPVLPPVPHSPNPPDDSDLTPGSVTVLTWLPESDPCDPLTWEVTINGRVVAITDQPRYDLPEALSAGLVWQVTAVDAQGDRAPGPEWHLSVAAQGWLATPPDVRLQPSPASAARSVRWLVIGAAAAGGLILLGVLRLIWRRRRVL